MHTKRVVSDPFTIQLSHNKYWFANMSWSAVLRRSSSLSSAASTVASSSVASSESLPSLCLVRRERDPADLRKYCEEKTYTFERDDPNTVKCQMLGPEDTPYANHVFTVRIELTKRYPLSSPSVGFGPKQVWHPNVDFESGSVCLDLLNNKWTPVLNLVHIVDILLPQLLHEPNPESPLNTKAASEFEESKDTFNEAVKKILKTQKVPKIKKSSPHHKSSSTKSRKRGREESLLSAATATESADSAAASAAPTEDDAEGTEGTEEEPSK